MAADDVARVETVHREARLEAGLALLFAVFPPSEDGG